MDRTIGAPLAYGRTAEIYAWDAGTVLKLFYDWYGADAIAYELRIARAVAAAADEAGGHLAPWVGNLVEVNGRTGLVYQRVPGTSMVAAMGRAPWRLGYYARRMAALQAGVHAIPGPAGIPLQRDRLGWKIRAARSLPEPTREKALVLLDRMPVGAQLCHGDFHPENILVDGQRETIIDWVDASTSSPLADVARTTILLLGAVDAGQKHRPLIRELLHLFHSLYLRHYFSLRPGGEEEYRRWLPLVAAGRVSEGISDQEAWLIRQAERL